MTEDVAVTAEFEALAYTETRHLLLAFAGSGPGQIDRHEYVGIPVVWVQHTINVAYTGNDVRTLNALMSHGLIAYHRLDDGRHHKSAIEITGLGQRVLAEWDAEHPEHLPELQGPWVVDGNIAMADAPGDEIGKTLGVMISNAYLNLRVTAETDGLDLERIADALTVKLTGSAQGTLL